MRGQVKIYQKKIVLKRRRRLFYISFYTFVLTGLLISALSYMSQLESISLQDISVRGVVRVDTEEVIRIVKEHITGNYGILFSKANAFIYPKEDIISSLMSLPVIKHVEVSRSGFNTLVIDIEERGEVARWCEEGESPCFSLDENGLVFIPLSHTETSSSTLFTYKGSIGNPLGKNIFPGTDFKKIQFFIHEIEALSVNPLSASLSSTTEYMTIALLGGGRIIINTGDDLSETLENISLVLKDKTVAPSFSDFLNTLDYIKFDAGNKVVYKMRVK